MWPFRHRRFRELVDRQLSIFADDHAELVEQARAALRAYWSEQDASDSLEHYGNHDELAAEVEELLDDMYRHFAATLDGPARRAYRATFAKRAKAAYGDLLPRLTFDSDDDKLPE